MLFRQLFDSQTSTYSYLLADRGQAVLIDPVKEHLDTYLQLLSDLDLQLVMALDTHTHADHITALGDLREATGCNTGLGQESQTRCVSFNFHDGQSLAFGGRELRVLHTPGHTHDSYCFLLAARGRQPAWLFSGDTLLIRGSGRTDFQNGSARQQWSSLQRLLDLGDDTLVFPAHDYKGWTCSSIGEERRHNPRLQVANAEEYAALMDGQHLPPPRLLNVALAANRACGRL
ncbi:MBL fold metallo-hydrolase [Pseudomonas sp. DTU_2021_1001937_2_SI_NGA_ILE_001]|uniref:MBL fold metallo-hydrolase n=1 Tax=Pseudomonas sp. DTU_2021_1001937_2_SI_NGA_ILE_001 TaxID=3077589 RepID=UPI0025D35783|nr:MBL fold metallo-hydrolase [Pseudomonas sp. DTU_2021_1001937_2_SI_NGA_ILE_001]WNW14074.1 MBL fold metallo-hydrolase [Pseudomonas sp. DTU_2021_1001937_2_SI_NGA_ILE_001]